MPNLATLGFNNPVYKSDYSRKIKLYVKGKKKKIIFS